MHLQAQVQIQLDVGGLHGLFPDGRGIHGPFDYVILVIATTAQPMVASSTFQLGSIYLKRVHYLATPGPIATSQVTSVYQWHPAIYRNERAVDQGFAPAHRSTPP